MYFSPSLDRLYAPYMAGWYFGMMVCLHWWASFGGTMEPPRGQHLRLVSDRGRLV
jgi:hypothetical protein